MKKYLMEIGSRLSKIKPTSPSSIWKAESYIGGGRSRLIFLDLKIPDIRNEYQTTKRSRLIPWFLNQGSHSVSISFLQ